jgi:hypothetical protein
MPKYVLELYGPGSDPRSVRSAADRLAVSARQLCEEGTPVRYLDTIFLPGDETGLHVFEAGSEADVRVAAQRAGIEADRVVPAEHIEPLEATSPMPPDNTTSGRSDEGEGMGAS